MRGGSRIGAGVLAAVLASSAPASAAPQDDAVLQRLKELEDKVQYMGDLEQELALLKRRVEVKEEAEAARGPQPQVGAGPDGFSLQSADRKWVLKLRGYTQADSRWYQGDEDNTVSDAFVFRRVRPIFEGTLAEWIDFRIMPDFANSALVLQDAYTNLRPFGPLAQLQVGKFKAPFGLERLQSGTALTFIERGLPTNLAPNRDLGVQLWGDWRSGLLTYQLAVMNGVTDGDNNDAKDFVGRLFAKPFQNLGFGVALSYGRETGTPRNYVSAGQQTFYSWNSGVTLDEGRLRVTPQLYWSWGPAGLLGEFVRSDNTVQRGLVQEDIEVQSWQLAGSYVLTGENASFNGVVPRAPSNPSGEGWGAFEVAGRYGKLQLNYARTWYEGGAAFGEDRDTENSS